MNGARSAGCVAIDAAEQTPQPLAGEQDQIIEAARGELRDSTPAPAPDRAHR